jgi:predicted methyltransferase
MMLSTINTLNNTTTLNNTNLIFTHDLFQQVAHESPRWVSKSIFAEAFRILKPGGSFTMLDLDKGGFFSGGVKL